MLFILAVSAFRPTTSLDSRRRGWRDADVVAEMPRCSERSRSGAAERDR
jgi:hypothetical protein